MSGSRRRLLELDAFRGIASLGVLFFHYYYHVFEVYGPAERAMQVFEYGQYGVELFFMISGFVIFMSLERTYRVIDFVVSRFARLFPVYWLSIAITTAVVWHFGLPDREVSLRDTLINLTMLEEFANVPKVDGAYWTLTLELCFYILIGTAWFTGALKRFHLTAGLALAFLAVAQSIRHFSGFEFPWKIMTFFMMEYGHLFLLGMLLYRHATDRTTRLTWVYMAGCLLLCLFHGWLVTGLVLGFTGLFFAVRHGWLQVLCVRPLLFFGAISYSLYIVHQNTGYVILRELTEAGMSWPMAQALTSLLAIAVATAMTYLVERPAARLVRRWWKAFKARRLPVPEVASPVVARSGS